MIDCLQLPDVFPNPDAMKSWGSNRHDYEQEFWEFQYKIYRYLGRLSDAALAERYAGIVRNMTAIVSAERHVIPIHSFLSSWYWYRKEHQTRFEFAQRKLPLPQQSPIIRERIFAAPARPRGPNASDVLFRYGSRTHLEEMLQIGKVRIAAARTAAELENDPARKDDELNKNSFMPGAYTKITTLDGKELSVIGDLKRTVTGVDYFFLSASCDWDPIIFDALKVDSCIVIRKPDEFACRLMNAAKVQLDGWQFHHNPIEYFDPYEQGRQQRIDNVMSKDFWFAYQREYRFLWAGFHGQSASGHKFIELGPLSDIAELHYRGSG